MEATHPKVDLLSGASGKMQYTAQMAKQIRLREMTQEEQAETARLARSRTAEARKTERAKIVLLAQAGNGTTQISQEMKKVRPQILHWIKRFNEFGLAGLEDEPRSGRPPTYSPEQVSEVVAAALTSPQELGQPFASWTLDRLAVYLHEVKGIAIKRSRIGEILTHMRDYAGASMKHGLANGSILSLRKKGGH